MMATIPRAALVWVSGMLQSLWLACCADSPIVNTLHVLKAKLVATQICLSTHLVNKRPLPYELCDLLLRQVVMELGIECTVRHKDEPGPLLPYWARGLQLQQKQPTGALCTRWTRVQNTHITYIQFTKPLDSSLLGHIYEAGSLVWAIREDKRFIEVFFLTKNITRGSCKFASYPFLCWIGFMTIGQYLDVAERGGPTKWDDWTYTYEQYNTKRLPLTYEEILHLEREYLPFAQWLCGFQ